MGKAKGTKKEKPQGLPDPAAKLPKGSVPPTSEWLGRYDHRIHTTHSEPGLPPGRAYMRRPWFESLVERDWSAAGKEKRAPLFTVAHLKALRFYREVSEASERSETKSCLASGNGGGTRGGWQAPEPSISIITAKSQLRAIEGLLAALLPTMRAVAVLDMSYAQVAMARFGSREVDHYDDATGAFVKRMAPRSGRHTAKVREEFQAGVELLTHGRRLAEPSIRALPNGAVVIDDPHAPISQRPISDAIDAKLAECPNAGGIAASVTVCEAIARENGVEFDHEADELGYRGLPVTVKRGWREGAWVVVEA